MGRGANALFLSPWLLTFDLHAAFQTLPHRHCVGNGVVAEPWTVYRRAAKGNSTALPGLL